MYFPSRHLKNTNVFLFFSSSPCESLVVLKVLPECLQEEPELPELDVVRAVLVFALRLVLGKVEGAVDGRLAVEQLVGGEDVADALVNLERKILFLFPY